MPDEQEIRAQVNKIVEKAEIDHSLATWAHMGAGVASYCRALREGGLSEEAANVAMSICSGAFMRKAMWPDVPPACGCD